MMLVVDTGAVLKTSLGALIAAVSFVFGFFAYQAWRNEDWEHAQRYAFNALAGLFTIIVLLIFR